MQDPASQMTHVETDYRCEWSMMIAGIVTNIEHTIPLGMMRTSWIDTIDSRLRLRTLPSATCRSMRLR